MSDQGRQGERPDRQRIATPGRLQVGDPVQFSEQEVEDWTISRPDGSEEGNVVGKFLDTWHQTHP
ncbi:MAG: hypothetical protein IPI49_25370 [Myxococcales bacterium]|nr:hypothetical protein [Myxococcales bacterium]